MCESHPIFALNSNTFILVCTLLLYVNSAVADQLSYYFCLLSGMCRAGIE